MENWFQFDGHHIDMSQTNQTNINPGTEKLGRRKHASSMRFDKSEAYFFSMPAVATCDMAEMPRQERGRFCPCSGQHGRNMVQLWYAWSDQF